ncbi:ATP-binding protein [Streptomyces sp. NPDC057445]|uniref:ATP-binding protein n=1 Tax=Streptomyces sp. NPDC057445 TaxID=3346136 RepID=UPI0036907F28
MPHDPLITGGVGKTHIAQTLGHLAVRQGAHVRFAKTSRILADLARRPRGPHLGETDPRTHPARRPHPRRLRDAPAVRGPRPTTSTNSSPSGRDAP